MAMDIHIVAPHSRPGIVLIDDDAAVRRAMLMLLRAHDFDVKAYGLGGALICDPSVRSARLLITDWQMSDMNGFAVLASLRATGWTGAALMVTGYYADELVAKAAQHGFSFILPKPVADHVLIDTVTRLLGSGQYNDRERFSVATAPIAGPH